MKETGDVEREKVDISKDEGNAIRAFIATLDETMDGEAIQNCLFQTANENGLKPAKFFKLIYTVLLGVPRGPRAGNLIKTIGIQRTKDILGRELS